MRVQSRNDDFGKRVSGSIETKTFRVYVLFFARSVASFCKIYLVEAFFYVIIQPIPLQIQLIHRVLLNARFSIVNFPEWSTTQLDTANTTLSRL